jgi:hypothetical protein
MLSSFPKILLPVTQYTTYDEELVGKVVITEDSTLVTGVETKFTIQCTIGSELFVDDISIGFIGEIIDDVTMKLEEPAAFSQVATTALIKIFDPSALGTPLMVTDIFRRVAASEKYTERGSALMPYRVSESETIEAVSSKIYRSPFYHWVLLIINGIVDPREEWPLTEEQLQEKIRVIYSTKLTGTIFSDFNTDVATGENTLFTQELKVGDYILDIRTSEVIGQVLNIISDTAVRLVSRANKTYTGYYKYSNNSDIYEYREVETGYVADYDLAREVLGEIQGVSIYDYLSQKNDAKRLVKILKPGFLLDFVTEYRKLINQTT